MRRGGAGALLMLLVLLVLPSAAAAHAVLVDSSPARGAALRSAPERVVLRFNEPVETAFQSLRVFDARGQRVDSGAAERPGGDSKSIAVGLRPGLPEGSYTVAYRVVSADSHPVSGGFLFSVGDAGAPAAAVADVLDEDQAGPITDVGFGVAKGVSYAAIALAAGGAIFLFCVWLPGLREASGPGGAWREASKGFAGRLTRVAAVTCAAGAAASVAGIVLQAATASGTGFWGALDPDPLGDVLDTRFGFVWGLRLVDWLVLAAVLGLVAARRSLPALRPASLGATGLAAPGRPRAGVTALLALTLGFLVVSPALAGHASATDPRVLSLGADILHVLAMSVWIGGLALLVLALPAATRRLAPGERTRLLAAVLLRFSRLALLAVAVLLASGIVQSVIHLESLSDPTGTAFGRAILVKAALLAGLVALGALNRRRSLPRLRALAAGGDAPGQEGHVLRRTLRSEVVLLAVVLGVTAALTSYPPPAALADGPFSATAELSPARVELTVEPGRTGINEIHVYLTDPRTGAQYDRLRDLGLELSLPSRRIGPLRPRVDKAGPGHWVARRATIAPSGSWRLTLRSRVSEFEERRTTIGVPVE